MAELPNWVKNKMEYNNNYSKKNFRRCIFALNRNTEPELIEVYDAIPNKSQWFKECLRRYAAELGEKDV